MLLINRHVCAGFSLLDTDYTLSFLCDKEPIIILSSFQSFAHLLCSAVLLLSSLILRGDLSIKNDGILGHLECSVWHGYLLLWSSLFTSTWNLVCLTVER